MSGTLVLRMRPVSLQFADMANCPICKRKLPTLAPSTAPFCSARCKDIDLNRWFDGAYQVPVERDEATDDEEPLDVWVDPNADRRKR